MSKIYRSIIMALSVDKDGKVFEKKLNMSEDAIRKIIANRDVEHHKKILQRASRTKITKRMAS